MISMESIGSWLWFNWSYSTGLKIVAKSKKYGTGFIFF